MISTIPNVQVHLIIHKKGGSRDELAKVLVVSALGYLDVVDRNSGFKPSSKI